MTTSMELFGVPVSGHVHRVKLFLKILGIEYKDHVMTSEFWGSQTFRALNPMRQIPVLKDGDTVIADSNAILVYLAKRYGRNTQWLPEDFAGAANVQRWLSIAAGEIRFGPATARALALGFMKGDDHDRAAAHRISDRILVFMEQHLGDRKFLASQHPTIADLACYSYVAHAPEGGVDIAPYPSVQAWLKRVESLPDFAPMPSAKK